MSAVRLLAGTWIDGRHRDAGETVEVREPLARLLVQANRAVRVEPEPPARPLVAEVPVARPPAQSTEAQREPPRRRR